MRSSGSGISSITWSRRISFEGRLSGPREVDSRAAGTTFVSSVF
jgi:hypothetical protein